MMYFIFLGVATFLVYALAVINRKRPVASWLRITTIALWFIAAGSVVFNFIVFVVNIYSCTHGIGLTVNGKKKAPGSINVMRET
jgi:hypothetical protein